MATGGTHSQGAFSKCLFEPAASPHTFDASSEIYPYLKESIKKTGRIVGYNEITGSRSRRHERSREGVPFYKGRIVKYISPGELATLLPKMLGAAASGNNFALAEDVPYFGMLFDRDQGTMQYVDCKIDSWFLSGSAPELEQEGEPDLLLLTLDIIASGETVGTAWPAIPPTLGTTAAYQPYVLADADGGVTIKGSVRPIVKFVLAGYNMLYARTVNSLTVHSIIPRDRAVMARFQLPWNSDNSGLYVSDLPGATASIVLTNGTVSTTFTMDRLQIPQQTPTAEAGKNEIPLILDGYVTDISGGSDELAVVNDSTV